MADPKYQGPHQAIRRALAPSVPGTVCWRCGKPILAGQPWDLGHDDAHPGQYKGPEHAHCSRAAGARKGNLLRRLRQQQLRQRKVPMDDVTIGVEVSEDRAYVAVAVAGRLDDGRRLIDQVEHLPGTDPTLAVRQVLAQRQVKAAVVDPHSPGATTIPLLRAAAVAVVELSTSDVVLAHGEFIDDLKAGAITYRRNPALTEAMRLLEQRRLGGAYAPERRGGADVSPAVAAVWACWGVAHAKPPKPKVAPWVMSEDEIWSDDEPVVNEVYP